MSERFYSTQPITGDRVTLDGPEAHHLLHVMRATAGHSLTLFDGSGAEFTAVVETIGRSAVDLRITERREVERELSFALTVGIALPKGDRQKWLIEKLTELGVTTLVPLVTERGVAQPNAAALERLRRTVIEASKQCGRNRLMQIDEPQSWSKWISFDCGLRIADCGLERQQSAIRNPKSAIQTRRLLAHPGGIMLSAIELRTRASTNIAIGPEGGFTDAEFAAAIAAGWQGVELGRRTLRTETAAIALAAILAAATPG